jgi:hypothetical protein
MNYLDKTKIVKKVESVTETSETNVPKLPTYPADLTFGPLGVT